MLNKLIELFEKANEEFLKTDIELITSDVAERALCASLMCFLREKIQDTPFQKYYVDTEYNRNQGKIKTVLNNNLEVVVINCDLIIHSRGKIIEQDNLIALEMKKSSAPKADKESDKIRLTALTKSSYDDVWSFDGVTLPKHVCGYVLGVYYEINRNLGKIKIEYYSQGKKFRKYAINLRQFI